MTVCENRIKVFKIAQTEIFIHTLIWLKSCLKRYYRKSGLSLAWNHIEACQVALFITTTGIGSFKRGLEIIQRLQRIRTVNIGNNLEKQKLAIISVVFLGSITLFQEL